MKERLPKLFVVHVNGHPRCGDMIYKNFTVLAESQAHAISQAMRQREFEDVDCGALEVRASIASEAILQTK